MNILLSEKINSIINNNALKFSLDNFNHLAEIDYDIAISFAQNNIAAFCSVLKETQQCIDFSLVDNLLEIEDLTTDQCQILIDASSEQIRIRLGLNSKAMLILLNQQLDINDIEQLPDIWENSEDVVRKKIEQAYVKFAEADYELSDNIPHSALTEILDSSTVAMEYKKTLFASNIYHLSKEQIVYGLGQLGLNHFKGVVIGSYPKKMTKTSCYAANKKIAEQLRLKGLINTWSDDWNNANYTWVYGFKERQ